MPLGRSLPIFRQSFLEDFELRGAAICLILVCMLHTHPQQKFSPNTDMLPEEISE